MKVLPLRFSTAAVLLVVFFMRSIPAKADTLTMTVELMPDANTSAKTFTVPSNTVAQVLSAHCRTFGPYWQSSIILEVNGRTAGYAGSESGVVSNLPPVLVGPAKITLSATWNGSWFPSFSNQLFLCTIQTTPATSSLSFTPSSSVVIPNDGGGPVTIILESSTDLISWTAANPGTYGTTSSNRFFRVRAQR